MKYKTLVTAVACSVLSFHAFAADTNADNTAKNARDKMGETLTPVDQSSKPADIKITADTRSAIVKNSHLSMDAKNVKIITIDGVVTLRGPVNSDKEKALIAKYAMDAGASKVTNELEVKSNK